MDNTGEQRIALKVGGMTCEHCAARVKKALDATAQVIEATVDLDSGTADVRLAGNADSEALITSLEKVGYTASAL